MFENIFGFIAFFTSIIGLLPQVYKVLQTRSTHDLSMLMLINYLVCSFAWVFYGTYSHSTFVIWSNVIGLLSSLGLILLKMYFDSVNLPPSSSSALRHERMV